MFVSGYPSSCPSMYLSTGDIGQKLGYSYICCIRTMLLVYEWPYPVMGEKTCEDTSNNPLDAFSDDNRKTSAVQRSQRQTDENHFRNLLVNMSGCLLLLEVAYLAVVATMHSQDWTCALKSRFPEVSILKKVIKPVTAPVRGLDWESVRLNLILRRKRGRRRRMNHSRSFCPLRKG